MRTTIQVKIPKEITYYVPSKDKYSYTIQPKFKWLQKLAYWYLRKAKSLKYAMEEYTEITLHEFPVDKFTESILSQIDYLHRKFNKMPTEVWMGVETFRDICLYSSKNSDYQSHMFHVDLYFGIDGRRFLHGMRVRILPYMTGILVIPPDVRAFD
jgi:hypothetical protein